MTVRNNKEIYHHGILGQRWGRRNGPPYPLGSTDHSTSEKKAGWRKSLDKSPKSVHTKTGEKRGLTDRQKRAIKIGAVVVGTALVTYGTYKLYQSGKLDPLINKGKTYTNSLLEKGKAGSDDIGSWKVDDLSSSLNAGTLGKMSTQQKAVQSVNGIKKLSRAETVEETISKVNPHYNDSRYDNNCTYCSIASFLRQKGYDVTAGSTGGDRQNLGGVVEKCFKGAKVLDGSATKFGRSRQDAAEMLLKRYGQNAEGVCAVTFKTGTGHAFNWKIKNGVVLFFDGQSNRNDSVVSRYWRNIDPSGSLQLARLDGLEINFDAIKEILE